MESDKQPKGVIQVSEALGWVWHSPLMRLAAIVGGSLLILITAMVIIFGSDRGRPAYDPIILPRAEQPDNQITTTDLYANEIARTRQEIVDRFPDAPEEIRNIALGIASDRIPLSSYREALMALNTEEINASYGVPFPEKAPDYTHTLLRETVISGNTAAAAILLEKGADSSYNDNEMAFQAATLAPQPRTGLLAFPDHATGGKLLQLWIANTPEADIDLTHSLYGPGTLLMNTPISNLEAILILLDAGADPWSGFPIITESGDFLYELDPFFLRLATNDRIANEVAFRLAVAGHYESGPLERKEQLLVSYIRLARDAMSPETPRDHAQMWALQRAIEMILFRFEVNAGGDIRTFLRTKVSDEYGGFYLSEQDIRSPAKAGQRLQEGDPWGPYKWRDWPPRRNR